MTDRLASDPDERGRPQPPQRGWYPPPGQFGNEGLYEAQPPYGETYEPYEQPQPYQERAAQPPGARAAGRTGPHVVQSYVVASRAAEPETAGPLASGPLASGPSGAGRYGTGPDAVEPYEQYNSYQAYLAPQPPPPDTGQRQDTPAYTLPEVAESAWSVDQRRSAWISRGVLLCLLLVQAGLSLRLHGAAFEDEALYVGAGHYELRYLLHGTPLPVDFAAYFSGHPALYPVLAAIVDSRFGLTGVRVMSLAFMLGTTSLLYAMTRRLFNERAALCAVALFSVIQSTIFLGYFATYDALALVLLALAAWVVVRTGRSNPAAVLLAAPPMALAVAVKYASGLYLPTLVVLAVLSAYPYRGLRALTRGVLLAVATGALLAVARYTAGPIGGVSSTTTGRAHGTTPAWPMLVDSAQWGGLMFLVALGGSIAYVHRARMGEMPWMRGSTPGWVRRLLLGLVLTGTALLAPAYQIYLHTEISLFKHVGYGLLFAAPMAGLGVSRLVGPHFRYPQLGVMLYVTVLVFGMAQSQQEFSFRDPSQMVAVMRGVVTRHGHYLAEESEVPAYYLRDVTGWKQWESTFFISYKGKDGQVHTGDDGFRTAVHDGYYDAIVLNGDVTPDADRVVTAALHDTSKYRLLAVLPYTTSLGPGAYRVWVRQ